MSQDGSALHGESEEDLGGNDFAADVDAARQADAAEEVKRLSEELAQANDRTLRSQAELENFRRRMRREMDDERRYAALPLLGDLLSVLDNLERALAAAAGGDSREGNAATAAMQQGVEMVRAQFVAVLERHHCRRIGTPGDPFDPNVHQAIAQEPSEQIPAGGVTRVTQVGYQLHDRVVRPAQVMVSTGANAPGGPVPPSTD